MIYNDARKEQEYRSQTNNPSFAGVMYPSWTCKKCKKQKPLKGRKSLGKGKGFACADCVK